MPDTEVTAAAPTTTISSPASAGDTTSRQGTTGEPATTTEGQANTGNANQQQQTEQSQAVEISQDEILKAAQGQRTPEEEIELLNKANAASQREGIRLNSVLKAVEKVLNEQGLDLKLDPKSKEFKAVVPNKNYSQDVSVPTLSYDDLDEKTKELLADDPEKAVNSILSSFNEKVRSAVARVKPTADKVIEPVTESRLNATHEFLANRTDALGEKVYGDYEKQRPLIDSFINDPATPQWLKEAVATHTSEALPFIYSHLKEVQSRLTRKAQAATQQTQAKQEQGLRASELSPTGTGKSVIQGSEAAEAFIGGIKKAGR